jgi:hypothetical protein
MKKLLLFIMVCFIAVNTFSQITPKVSAINNALIELPPPSVTTNAASGVTQNQATLNGIVHLHNYDYTGVAKFQYGLTTAYGTTVVSNQGFINDTVSIPISKTITGLASNTTYHYRAMDSVVPTLLKRNVKNNESKEVLNIVQYVYGGDQTFTTPLAMPQISVISNNIEFGTSGLLSANRDTTIIITNLGEVDLSIYSIVFNSTNSQFQIIGSIPSTIRANSRDSIKIRLKTDSIGNFISQLRIINNSINSPTLLIYLHGIIVSTGTNPSSTHLDFNPTSITRAKDTLVFRVTNISPLFKKSFLSVINIYTKTINGDTGSFHFIQNNQNITLGPGQSDETIIEFYPKTIGSKTAVLTITTNDPLAPILYVNLTGSCSGSPKITSLLTLDFGELKYNETKDNSIIIKNDGNLPLTITDVSIKGNNADNFVLLSTNTGKILENTQMDTIKLRYTGKLPTGIKSAQIQITSNDNSQNPYLVNLSGFYRSPVLYKPFFRLFFDTTNVGMNINTTVTLGNSGNDTLRIRELFIDGPYSDEFSLSTLPGNIIPGGEYGVKVGFIPLGPGLRYARIAIRSNDPLETESTLMLIGWGKSAYYLSRSELLAVKNSNDLNNITLVWKKVQDALSYSIEISTETNFSSSTKYTSITETQKIISGLDINKKYYFRVIPQNNYIIGEWSDVSEFTLSKLLITEEIKKITPTEIKLYQNYPNPFNPSTVIGYQLPKNNYIMLKIFDVMGKEIANLVSENQPAGYHEVKWNAVGVPSGIYYYRLVAGEYVDMKKLILLK